MAASVRSKKPKVRPDDLVRRLAALTQGLVLEKILKADSRELVIEFADGTRLLVHAEGQLDISVTGATTPRSTSRR